MSTFIKKLLWGLAVANASWYQSCQFGYLISANQTNIIRYIVQRVFQKPIRYLPITIHIG